MLRIFQSFIISAILLLCTAPAWSAIRITGRVSDASGEPAAGAIIRVKSDDKTECHTLAGEDGAYTLNAPEKMLKNSSVEISCMGFYSHTLSLEDLVENPNIVLSRNIGQLDEFTVKGKSSKVSRPDWLGNAIIYEANLRRASAGKDLQGLTKRLSELKKLGFRTICLMPIHTVSLKDREGSLGWPYAVADYKSVDPAFGNLQDLKDLVRIAHLKGMKVLLDESCAYSGTDHHWVEAHPEYYALTDSGEFVRAAGRKDVYKFNYSNPGWRAAMIEGLCYWVSETGIDGFRFTDAADIPTDFWLRARKTIQQIKPIVFIADASSPELLKEAFDADYSWPLIDTFTALAATQGVNQFAAAHGVPMPQANADSVLSTIANQKDAFTKGALHLNMTSSHTFSAQEGNEFDRYGDAARAFAVLSYTLPGAPMVAAGQEVGWEEDIRLAEPDSVPDYSINPPMQLFYKKLNKLRRLSAALWQNPGQKVTFTPIATTSPDILAFERKGGNAERILVVINLSSERRALGFEGKKPKLENMVNYFFRHLANLPSELQPWEFQVFASQPKLKREHFYYKGVHSFDPERMRASPVYRNRFHENTKRLAQYRKRLRQFTWDDEEEEDPEESSEGV